VNTNKIIEKKAESGIDFSLSQKEIRELMKRGMLMFVLYFKTKVKEHKH